MKPETPTPRTNELEVELVMQLTPEKPFINQVLDFARTLERELTEALEHQEVPFHTCAGEKCVNKYCQMRQENERLRKEIQTLKQKEQA